MASPIVPNEGVLLGRARVPGFEHPRIVTVRGDDVVDILGSHATGDEASHRLRMSVEDRCERRRVGHRPLYDLDIGLPHTQTMPDRWRSVLDFSDPPADFVCKRRRASTLERVQERGD